MKVSATLKDKDGNVLQTIQSIEAKDLPVLGCLNRVGVNGSVTIVHKGV